jgi:hypothetical protein
MNTFIQLEDGTLLTLEQFKSLYPYEVYDGYPPLHIQNKYKVQIVTVPKSEEELAQEIREERNGLLQMSDWTQLEDAQVDKISWSEYRRALRDIPQQIDFPRNVVWPQVPV